jgi:hypothetical protein
MPNIIKYVSGPSSPDPDSGSPQPAKQYKEVTVTPNPKTRKQARDNKKAERWAEITVTPNPKTRKQARANKKAERWTTEPQRQAQGSPSALPKKTARSKRAARDRKRKAYMAKDANLGK